MKQAVENEDFDAAKMIKFELEKVKQQALSDQSKVLTPITHHFKEDPELISHYPEKESVRFQPIE